MIGGPETFGAGGWQGSRLEQELPVNMEVPAQRQIPKGALVLSWTRPRRRMGIIGANSVRSRRWKHRSQDEVGVISFVFNGWIGDGGMLPLEVKGDGSRVVAAIKNWELGDLPSFEDSITLALDG